MEKEPITLKGIEEIKKELKELKTIKRPKYSQNPPKNTLKSTKSPEITSLLLEWLLAPS